MYNYSVICFQSAAKAASSTMVRRSPRCRWPLEYHASPVGVLGCSNMSLSKYRPDMTLQMAGHVVQHAAGN